MLLEICERSLAEIVQLLGVEIIIGVGKFPQERARIALKSVGMDWVKVETIMHPSPVNPVANKDWEGIVTKQLEEMGVLQLLKEDAGPPTPEPLTPPPSSKGERSSDHASTHEGDADSSVSTNTTGEQQQQQQSGGTTPRTEPSHPATNTMTPTSTDPAATTGHVSNPAVTSNGATTSNSEITTNAATATSVNGPVMGGMAGVPPVPGPPTEMMGPLDPVHQQRVGTPGEVVRSPPTTNHTPGL